MPRLIALDMPGGPEFVNHLRRAWDAGDAVLPLDSRLSSAARQEMIESMAPAVVIGKGGNTTSRPRGRPVQQGDALVMLTSGTTRAKGVVLTHQAVEASAQATNSRLEVDADTDAWWACLPVAHIGGLSVITRCLAAGVRFETVGSFSVEGAQAAVAAGATMTSLVPTTLRRLGPALAGSFRRIVLGGQAPPPNLPPNVVTTYGMTETGSGIVYDGRPLEGVEVRIEPDTGEIHVRGAMLMRSYRDGLDPKDRDGWLPTGDSGSIQPDGTLAVQGRLSDMIISGGENVWPLAVERIVRRDPDVAEVAVVGLPDAEWGQRVVAYVLVGPQAPEPSVLLGRIRDLVREAVAPYAAPRQVVICESFPVTAIGKVRKELLSQVLGPTASV